MRMADGLISLQASPLDGKPVARALPVTLVTGRIRDCMCPRLCILYPRMAASFPSCLPTVVMSIPTGMCLPRCLPRFSYPRRMGPGCDPYRAILTNHRPTARKQTHGNIRTLERGRRPVPRHGASASNRRQTMFSSSLHCFV